MARDLGFDRVVEFAQALIRIPSPPGSERAVAERTRDEMQTLGFDDVWIDGAGNVIGRIAGRGEAPAVLLNCHLDVVDVGDPAGWEYPPHGGVVDGGFLHGRGAMDIKGPLAIQTYAAAHFVENRPAGDVYVAHTVLEERGGWGMEHLLADGRVKPAAVIIGESTKGDVCIGHRGRAELVVAIHGVAGHASAPERAANPLRLLGRVLQAIDEFAANLPADPILGRSTLAPTEITTLPASRNVIPDIARIVLDWRVLPDTTAESAIESLATFLRERVTPAPPFTISVDYSVEPQSTWTGMAETRRMFTPGFLLQPDHPIAQAAVQALTQAGGRPALRPWTFATDGGHSCGVNGVPTIGYAPGEERFAHTNRERLELGEARTCYEAYPSLIAAVQSAAARA